MRLRFGGLFSGGLIFGGAYHRNFTVLNIATKSLRTWGPLRVTVFVQNRFTFAVPPSDIINFRFDVSHHVTLGFRQTTVVVYHKALTCVSVSFIDWLGAGILRFAAREGNRHHEAKKQDEARTRKHFTWFARQYFPSFVKMISEILLHVTYKM